MDTSRRQSRPAQILRYLETRLSASNDALARHFGVGPKTITNDVRELNKLLAGTGAIEMENGLYRLYVMDQGMFSRFRTEICGQIDSYNSPPNRYGYIFRRLLSQTGPILIDDLAEDMYVGRSTVVADLGKLREMLAPYLLTITGTPNVGIELAGDELQLRFFILENMFDSAYSDYPLGDDFVEILETACRENHLDSPTTASLTRWFTIMIDRVLTEHPLVAMPGKYLSLGTTAAFELADNIVSSVATMIQISVPWEESVFLALPIAGMRTPADELGRKQFPISTENADLIQKILDEIGAEMGLHVPANALLKEFIYHVTYMLNRMKYRVYLKNLSLRDIEAEYPVAYRMAKIARRVLEQETSLTVIEDELGFIASYFQVYLEEQQAQSEPRYRVAIVSASGTVSARLIQSQLMKVMPEKTEYQILHTNEASRATLDQFDLVVTTALSGYSQLDTSSRTIELSEFFDNQEILRQINQLRYDRQMEMAITGGANSLLVSILDQGRFFTLLPGKSYLENTAEMVDRLAELGAVDAGFKERLLEREARSSMLLDEYIGFPHIVNELGTKVVFAMGVVPREPGEPGERVIFLLGLPNKSDYDDTILVKIYDEIIRFAGNRGELDEISRLVDYEQFFFHMARTPIPSRRSRN